MASGTWPVGEEAGERDRAGTSQPSRGGTAGQSQLPRGGRYQ